MDERGKGLDNFRKMMMNNTSIQKIVDYENADECFSGVKIDGGVCYFLINSQYNGPCSFTHICADGNTIKSTRFLKNEGINIIIRDNRQISIIQKIKKTQPDFMEKIVSARKPYGFRADLFNRPENYPETNLSYEFKEKYIKIYGVKGKKGSEGRKIGYIKPGSIKKGNENILKDKIFFSKAYTSTATVPPVPILAGKNEICTETFLEIGCFKNSEESKNCFIYIKTKFFRALFYYGRSGLNISKKNFCFVPLQDFTSSSDIDWSKSISEIDQQLYKKYELTNDEIKFIEENIQEMK